MIIFNNLKGLFFCLFFFFLFWDGQRKSVYGGRKEGRKWEGLLSRGNCWRFYGGHGWRGGYIRIGWEFSSSLCGFCQPSFLGVKFGTNAKKIKLHILFFFNGKIIQKIFPPLFDSDFNLVAFFSKPFFYQPARFLKMSFIVKSFLGC